MPFVPKAPPALAHLDDNVIARTLSKNFGDIIQSAKDLGVHPSDLRQRTRHRPKLLEWAHLRIDLFGYAIHAELVDTMNSPRASRRQWAAEKILAEAALRGDPLASLYANMLPARRSRSNPNAAEEARQAGLAQQALEQDAAAEQEREQTPPRARAGRSSCGRTSAVGPRLQNPLRWRCPPACGRRAFVARPAAAVGSALVRAICAATAGYANTPSTIIVAGQAHRPRG